MMYHSAELVFVLVLAGFGCGRAQQSPPAPCCSPDKFTVHYDHIVTKQTGNKPMEIYVENYYSAFDFPQAMEGMEITVYPVNGTELKLKIIRNFTAGFQWTLQGSQCTKRAISSTEAPFRCIPAGSTFEGTFTVGPEKLKVHTWLISVTPPITGHKRYTVTDYMCTPFSNNFIGIDTTWPPPNGFVDSGTYTDFTNGIEDPDRWFKLPPVCNNTTVTVHPMKQLFNIPRSSLMGFL